MRKKVYLVCGNQSKYGERRLGARSREEGRRRRRRRSFKDENVPVSAIEQGGLMLHRRRPTAEGSVLILKGAGGRFIQS